MPPTYATVRLRCDHGTADDSAPHDGRHHHDCGAHDDSCADHDDASSAEGLGPAVARGVELLAAEGLLPRVGGHEGALPRAGGVDQRAGQPGAVVGAHAQRAYLPGRRVNLTETVRHWRDYGPERFPTVHPSPRNTAWHLRNPWFETDAVPELRAAVAAVLD